jgi:hypothetical protein
VGATIFKPNLGSLDELTRQAAELFDAAGPSRDASR